MKTLIDRILRWIPVYRTLLAERDAAVRAQFRAEDEREQAVKERDESRHQALKATETVVAMAREKDEMFRRWIDWQARIARQPTVFYSAGDYPEPPKVETPVFTKNPTAAQLVADREREFEEQLAAIRERINAEYSVS